MEGKTLAEFLLYLQGPAIAVVAGLVLSCLAEHWPYWPSAWYQGLDPKNKRVVFAAVCFLLPILSATAGCAMGYQPWSVEQTFWPAIYQGGLAAFGIGTLLHTGFMGRARQPEHAGMAPS